MANDFPKFTARLERILPRLLSKQALNDIGDIVIENIRDRSKKSQTIASGRVESLAPLAASTKKQKKRKGQSTKSMLRDTGAMMRSLKTFARFAEQQVIVEPRDSKNKEKAGFAHEGSSNRPKRPFIPEKGLDNKTQKEVTNVFLKELRRQLRKI